MDKEELFEPDYEIHVISGMDTIYIALEKGNLEIRERVDKFLEDLKKEFDATIV